MSRELLPVASGRTAARTLARLVARRPVALVLTVLSYLALGLASIVPVLMIGRVVDTARAGDTASEMWPAALIIAASAVVTAVATAGSAAALSALAAPVLATIREDVLDAALHLPSSRIEAAGTGDVVSRVGDDVRVVTESLDEAVPAMLTSIVTLVFTIGGLFTLDWRLGLAGLAAAPSYVLALRWYLPRAAPMYRAERLAEGERADALVSGLSGAATLRELGRSADGRDRIERASRGALEVTLGVFRMYTRFGFRMNMSEMVGLAAVLTGGFVVVATDTGTVGDATAAALFFHRLFNPIGALLFLFDTVQSAGAALTRMVGAASMTPDRATGAPLSTAPVLRLSGVAHAYESGRPVLHPLDLVVAPGEHVAVVGATGAGKSTLGSIAARSLVPTDGRVRLGDAELGEISEAAARRLVSVVTQDVHVFAGTVRDNLLVARPEASDDELVDVLRRVDARWIAGLSDGLDTRVGDHGHPLTGAQSQQLALARVLLADPALVVLDEASAEAGSSGARDLERATAAVVEGRTALVIAHRLNQARDADRILVMEAGHVVEDGVHDDLVAAGGRYAELWQAWSSS